MDTLFYSVGLAAVAVSALTGALDAGRKQMDLVGAVLVGVATALGGGTIRDLLLDRQVFWVADQTYLLVAFGTGMLSFFVVRNLSLAPRLFLIPDAIGLALFTVVGTQVAMDWHAPWLVASLMGVTTGIVGGVLRDILCNDVPLVFLKGELYASAAWAGSLAFIAMREAGVSGAASTWCSLGIILGLRIAALAFGITLPAFRARK